MTTTSEDGPSIPVDADFVALDVRLRAKLDEWFRLGQGDQPESEELRQLLKRASRSGVAVGHFREIAGDDERWIHEDEFEADTATLASLGDALNEAAPDCPFGSSPSPISWRWSPPPKGFFEYRCQHGPPAHCFERRGERIYPCTCAP